jgi:hypothetical protein
MAFRSVEQFEQRPRRRLTPPTTGMWRRCANVGRKIVQSQHHGTHRAVVMGISLVGAFGLLLSGTAVLATSASAAGKATITYSPSVVSNGQTITVSGNAGGPGAPDLYVAVCENTPTASNCDQSLAGIGTPQAHILQVTPNQTTGAWGPVSFYVRQTIVTGHTPGGFDCKAAGTCVIGTTNSANPADHTYDSTKVLDFAAPAPPPPVPVPSPSVTVTSTPSPTVTVTPTPTPSVTSTSKPTPTVTPTPTPTPTPTNPGGLSITYTPKVVADGMTIQVSGNAGGPKAPDLYVAVCESAPTASNCDQSLTGVGGPQAHILQVSPNQTTGAWGPVSFFVRQVIVTGHTPGGYDCKAEGTCVIGTTNSANPADHTYDVTAPLVFTAATVPALPPVVPHADGPLTVIGASALTAGGTATVAGAGFAPDSLVRLGVYSTPMSLATVTADAGGAISATVTVPATLSGAHTMVAVGTAPSGSSWALTGAVTVVASSSGSGTDGSGTTDAGGTLPKTGGDGLPPSMVAAAGIALLLAGLVLVIGGPRPRQGQHR